MAPGCSSRPPDDELVDDLGDDDERFDLDDWFAHPWAVPIVVGLGLLAAWVQELSRSLQ
jgi:hypothetical protein